MITRVTNFNVYVLDQNRACDFYTNKLGFTIVLDVPMGNGHRWLTVSPPDHPDLEINLSPVAEGFWYSKESAEALRDLIKQGVFGCGVLTCENVYATYEELKIKGVEFSKPPKDEFYGTEALFKDDSGNWWSLAQLKKPE